MRIIPCAISILRIFCLIPLAMLFPAYPYAAFAVFAAGAISDWLDGLCARKLRAESKFGTILDPIADKIFYLGSLIILKDAAPTLFIFLVAFPFEALLIAIRFKKSYHANHYGKMKTVAQFCAIACIMLSAASHIAFLTAIGFTLGLIAVPLAWMSFSEHIRRKEKTAPM